MQQLSDFAMADSINLKSLGDKDRLFVERRLKSLFARQIWRNEGFYEVANAQDPVIKKALEVVSQ